MLSRLYTSQIIDRFWLISIFRVERNKKKKEQLSKDRPRIGQV